MPATIYGNPCLRNDSKAEECRPQPELGPPINSTIQARNLYAMGREWGRGR